MLSTTTIPVPSNFVDQAMESAVARHTSMILSVVRSDACPGSPHLCDSPVLPHTPPSQLLRSAASAPPVRRLRSLSSPPAASHPVLASAIAVACTAAPDSYQPPARLPMQRQLSPLFGFQASPTSPQYTPFAAAANNLQPPSLLNKVNNLPGPKDMLKAVLTQRQNNLSFQDSGMLSRMLQRASMSKPDPVDPAATSSTGSASRCAQSAACIYLSNEHVLDLALLHP